MIEAEEVGVTSANVDEMKASTDNPVIKRLLGMEGDLGKNLGVGPDWAYNIIKQVGNYGEVFEKHVGANTAARPAARRQRAVDQGRHPVRACRFADAR